MRKLIKRPKIYAAGPLGFSEAGRLFHNGYMVPMMRSIGFFVLDPWRLTSDEEVLPIIKMPYGEGQRTAWREKNPVIGGRNADAIKQAHVILGVLDGPDADSGTASEVGGAGGMNMMGARKFIVGYRGDFRLSADNVGSKINLQVEYWIRQSGSEVFSTLAETEVELRRVFRELTGEEPGPRGTKTYRPTKQFTSAVKAVFGDRRKTARVALDEIRRLGGGDYLNCENYEEQALSIGIMSATYTTVAGYRLFINAFTDWVNQGSW